LHGLKREQREENKRELWKEDRATLPLTRPLVIPKKVEGKVYRLVGEEKIEQEQQ